MGRWLTPKGQEIAQAERGVGESRQKKLCMQPPQTEEELCVQDSKTCNELDRKRLGNVCGSSLPTLRNQYSRTPQSLCYANGTTRL